MPAFQPLMTCATGHLKSLYSPYGLHFHDTLQDTYGSLSKIRGLFGASLLKLLQHLYSRLLISHLTQSEQLYISDPRALHEILVKENDTVFRHPQFIYECA